MNKNNEQKQTLGDHRLETVNMPFDPLENMHGAMKDIVPLFELDEEIYSQAIVDYVDQRVAELSEGAETGPVGNAYPSTEKFIGPKTEMIMASILSKPYFLNDNQAYVIALKCIRSVYNKHYKSKYNADTAFFNAVLNGSNMGQAVYFESYVSTDIRARNSVAADIVHDDDYEYDEVSIADFKYVAACQERAGVVYNVLKMCGINARFEKGDFGLTDENGNFEGEAHAFITVISPSGRKVIFDPTNPILVKNEEGRVVSIAPSLYAMENHDLKSLEGQLVEKDTNGKDIRRRQVFYTLQ